MPIDKAGKCPLKRFGMIETRKLMEEIDAFLRHAQIAETTFGRRAVNDGKLVARLRAGGSVNLEKAAQIRRFILAAGSSSLPSVPERRASQPNTDHARGSEGSCLKAGSPASESFLAEAAS